MLRDLKSKRPQVGTHPELLIGLAQPDDAAVYRLGDGRVLIATVDFFTPIVDDPFDYGRIAAANALSDVYAMGGEPFLALSVAAFPDQLPPEMVAEILAGAAETVEAAGAVLAGGHTVRDAEPKFGLAALGFGTESQLIAKSGARAGDRLWLSKPLGTGALSTALKRDQLPPDPLAAAVASMARLSRHVAQAAREAGVRGGTDVTGFSLAGHALELAEASQADLRIEWSAVPLLPFATEAVGAGFVPGGTRSNDAAFQDRIEGLDRMDPSSRALLFDPQTSGGLLLAIPTAGEQPFRAALSRLGEQAWPIGSVTAGRGRVVIG